MASTALGAQLTELQYRQQVALRAGVMADTLKLTPMLDVASIDAITATWPPFEQAAGTLVEARYANSSGIAARYFDMFRTAEGIGGTAAALLAEPLAEEQIVTSLRVTGLYQTRSALAQQAANVEQNTIVRLLGSITRLVSAGGRNTIDRSVEGDKQALGYARVTSGRACAFCSLLASRGPVYKKDTAVRRYDGKKYHDHCHCVSEPVYSHDQPWPGNGRQLRELYDRVTANAKNSADARRLFAQALETV